MMYFLKKPMLHLRPIEHVSLYIVYRKIVSHFFNIRVNDASKTVIIASESVHDYPVTKLRAQLRYFLRKSMLHL